MSTRLLLEGTDLPELMAHVRAEFGSSARIVRAERVRSGGFAGFFARQRYELTVDVVDEPHTRPRAMRQHPAPSGLEALLAAADAAEIDAAPGQDLASLAGQGVTAASPADAGPRVSTGEEAFASVLDQVRAMAGGAVIADVEVPAPGARTFEPLVPATATPSGGVGRDALRDLGVPEHYLARVAGTGPVLLSAVLEALPAVPRLPRTAGSVVVVAGPAGEALAVAMQLAERLGQPTSSVVLAGRAEATAGHGRRVATVVAARRWRGQPPDADGQVAVVALGVGPDSASRGEAAELLEAFAPDQVWGVVDAHSKLRDCARWLAETGARRRIDVLAVRGVFETTQPGTVLDLGVPVAWIDGLPATRVAWAAALSDRLGAAARWD